MDVLKIFILHSKCTWFENMGTGYVIQFFLKIHGGRSKLCKKFQEWYCLLAFHLFIAFLLTRVLTIFLFLDGFNFITLEHSDTDNNKQKVTVTIYYLFIYLIF